MEESGGGPSKRLMYTPHLKKVLKSYQASATKSLHGPNSVMGVWQQGGSESSDASVSPPATSTAPLIAAADPQQSTQPGPSSSKKEYDPFVAPPPFPIQQPPIFTPADQTGWEKSETVLEGETISCFSVGGEERLCLPVILNTVLRDFSLHQINYVCDTLHIYCSRCTPSQLETLKASGVLPCNAPSCGLITKTDAQRLCAALIDASPPLIVTRASQDDMKQPPFQVRVYHECFGRCEGLYTPDLFQHPLAPCIECLECHALLCPQKFVCHVHPPKETRTCHWGFDVLRWRAYVLLAVDLEEEARFQQALLEMKERFGAKYKRKQILEESFYPSGKRARGAGGDMGLSYPMGMDPMLVYYYSQPHLWENAFQAYPSVITKDGKTLYIPPESFPQLIQKSMHSLRNRLALNPANVQKVMKIPEESTVFAYHAQKAETLSKRPHIKKDPDHDSISCFDSEDAYSDTSFSTLSAGTEDGLVSTLDDEDDLQPENDLVEVKKSLNDVVDASLRTRILSEVEALVGKYRKCLSVAVQGKKLYQMELEKIHYTQRAKLHKLREKNKILERELHRLKNNVSDAATTTINEQSERRTTASNPASPQQQQHSATTTDAKDISTDNSNSPIETDTQPPEEEVVTTPLDDEELEPDVINDNDDDIDDEDDDDSICSSPIQPKLLLQDDIEPLGK